MPEKRLLFLVIVSFFLATISAKAQYQTFVHGGINRQYIFHRPAFLPPGAPLVFVLHGYNGTAVGMDYIGMNAIADSNLFTVCYPEGTKDEWNRNCWNLGYDFQAGMTVDDVDFLNSLAVHLQSTYNLDPGKTFCTGLSNGGDMCYLLACQESHIFKAVAPVAGCLMQWIHDSCNITEPIPVFEIHGTNDQITLWDGDLENTQGYGPYFGVLFTFDFWVNVNNCITETIDTLPNLDPTDHSIVISDIFTDGINGNQVWLYTIDGGGHGWPGTAGNNMDINASAEVWSFFENVTTSTTLGVPERENKLISIFPVPASDYIILRANSLLLGSNYIICDLFGRTIITGEINCIEKTVDISRISKGVYLFKIGSTFTQTQLFIKE